MAVQSCGYPILHPFDSSGGGFIDYTISVKIGTVLTPIYSGTITPYNTAATTTEIDISEVCRDWINTHYENISFAGDVATIVPTVNNIASIHTFVVSSGSNKVPDPDEPGSTTGGDVEYIVKYDYGTDYIQPLADSGNLNLPIDLDVDPRQRIGLSYYNSAGGVQSFSWTRNGRAGGSANIPGAQIKLYSVNLRTRDLSEGDKLAFSGPGLDTPIVFTVVKPCPHRYALYYVNKAGGFDALLCTGNHTEGWSPSRTDVKFYDNRLSRMDWQQRRINTEIDHTFVLNTGLLSDVGAYRIDNLIYSPKVFLHDLDEDTITSVIIANTTYTAKYRRKDGLVQYTINVTESQKQLRR